MNKANYRVARGAAPSLPQLNLPQHKMNLFEHLYTEVPDKWRDFFMQEEVRNIIAHISEVIESENEEGADVLCPPIENVFRVFKELGPQDIKVVIMSQDPYHQITGAATGLAFSTPKSHTYINPSVLNMKKHIKSCGFNEACKHGNLEHLVPRGVFLFNAALTVRAKKPKSHTYIWSPFTARVIQYISRLRSDLVFMLWGRDANMYADHIINKSAHCIISNSHPSGLSAYTRMGEHPSFMTSKCFLKANEYLKSRNLDTINWGE